MTDGALQSALREQLARILEEAAFMLVEDPDAPLPDPGPAIEAKLPFTGRVHGTCWLAVSEGGSQHLANEMLGDELDPQSKHCEHATAELLNILTAWVLDAWWGANVPHEMGTPSTARSDFASTVVWSLPSEQRAVVATDSGHTFICGVTFES